ncbi:MAG: hypothetical protein GY723_17195 [bacterium]|nr:hypothetical protein [bacterium]MCP5069120.1 hypothetical protein [bacterium]
MATLKQDSTLKHQANLGMEVEEVTFTAGEEITLLKEWSDYYLVKNDAGQMFNIPKDQVRS